MANTRSAKKALRSSKKKNLVNKANKEAYKEARKAVAEAVKSNKPAKAKKLLPEAYQKLDYAAKKRTIHQKTADRYKSRLTLLVNSSATKK